MKGYIYSIKSPNTDEIYIGSTEKDLPTRFYFHKWDYENRKGFTTSSKILEYGDAYIELIEEMDFDDVKELGIKEGEYQSNMKCVNKQIECNDKKKYATEYYSKNREKRLLAYKEWCKNNMDKRRITNRKCREKHKDKRNKELKERYANNRVDCYCGGSYSKYSKERHFKTKKHQSYENKNNDI